MKLRTTAAGSAAALLALAVALATSAKDPDGPRVRPRQQAVAPTGDGPLRNVMVPEGAEEPAIWIRKDAVEFGSGKRVPLQGQTVGIPYQTGVVLYRP